jgi:hypothetical protein
VVVVVVKKETARQTDRQTRTRQTRVLAHGSLSRRLWCGRSERRDVPRAESRAAGVRRVRDCRPLAVCPGTCSVSER